MRNKILIRLGVLLGIGLIVIGIYRLNVEFKNTHKPVEFAPVKIEIDNELNLDNVREYIKFLKIKHPEWVLKQVILESGWLKSYNTIARNNLTGFRTSKGYIIFANWKECLQAYKRWQDKYYIDTTLEYSSFIKKIGYAEAENYIETINNMKINE